MTYPPSRSGRFDQLTPQAWLTQIHSRNKESKGQATSEYRDVSATSCRMSRSPLTHNIKESWRKCC